MILTKEHPARAGARLLFGALALLTAACSGGATAPSAGLPTNVQSLSQVRDAGLKLYDTLGPLFDDGQASLRYAASLGPGQLTTSSCAARYQARPLRARCAALSAVIAVTEGQAATQSQVVGLAQMLSLYAPGMGTAIGHAGTRLAEALTAGQGGTHLSGPAAELVAALRADAPTLYTLGRAARAEALESADFAWLAEMDQVFDRAKGRSLPKGLNDLANFQRLTRRVDAMLKRPEPGYGAASLYAVMAEDGRRLSPSEVAALANAIGRAEQALGQFDQIAQEWRAIAAAIDDYDALLAAAGQRIVLPTGGGQVENRLAALFSVKTRAASLLAHLNRIGAPL